MSAFDPRLTAARPDLAAASLEGLIEAARFVEGQPASVAAPILDLRRAPRPDAPLDTQIPHGERVRVYDEAEGWSWVQAERDSYVGYVASHGLTSTVADPTHRVVALRTFVYPAPDMKSPVVVPLPMGALVRIERGDDAAFARIDHGYLFAGHLAPLATLAEDPVAVAERLLGLPYLWGGRTPDGIDCSGLVQLAFAMAGQPMPRDAYRQETVGTNVPLALWETGLRRGDLVFWPGHVGVMRDGSQFIHANAHHMTVASESLRDARDRIAASPGGTSIKRISRVIAEC